MNLQRTAGENAKCRGVMRVATPPRSAVTRRDVKAAAGGVRPRILDIRRKRHRTLPGKRGIANIELVPGKLFADAAVEDDLPAP